MSTIKSKPMLFSGEMVRALLAGRKTQTRRIVKGAEQAISHRTTDGRHFFEIDDESRPRLEGCFYRSCPYGKPGDLLWVRESTAEDVAGSASFARYTADNSMIRENGNCLATWWYSKRSCPSIHMPRWASRLTLEITGVRVERLQDISEEDARAEGAMPSDCSPDVPAVYRFSRLWRDINGETSWDANPWVWVIEFKAHHCNVDALIKQREAV